MANSMFSPGTSACDVKLDGADKLLKTSVNGGIDGVFEVLYCHSGKPLYVRHSGRPSGTAGSISHQFPASATPTLHLAPTKLRKDPALPGYSCFHKSLGTLCSKWLDIVVARKHNHHVARGFLLRLSR
jgi:hypothetical protein